jgi:hypothetical protein
MNTITRATVDRGDLVIEIDEQLFFFRAIPPEDSKETEAEWFDHCATEALRLAAADEGSDPRTIDALIGKGLADG